MLFYSCQALSSIFPCETLFIFCTNIDIKIATNYALLRIEIISLDLRCRGGSDCVRKRRSSRPMTAVRCPRRHQS